MSTDKLREVGTGPTSTAWPPIRFLTNHMIRSQGGKSSAENAREMKAVDPHADQSLRRESIELAAAGNPLLSGFPPFRRANYCLHRMSVIVVATKN